MTQPGHPFLRTRHGYFPTMSAASDLRRGGNNPDEGTKSPSIHDVRKESEQGGGDVTVESIETLGGTLVSMHPYFSSTRALWELDKVKQHIISGQARSNPLLPNPIKVSSTVFGERYGAIAKPPSSRPFPDSTRESTAACSPSRKPSTARPLLSPISPSNKARLSTASLREITLPAGSLVAHNVPRPATGGKNPLRHRVYGRILRQMLHMLQHHTFQSSLSRPSEGVLLSDEQLGKHINYRCFRHLVAQLVGAQSAEYRVQALFDAICSSQRGAWGGCCC